MRLAFFVGNKSGWPRSRPDLYKFQSIRTLFSDPDSFGSGQKSEDPVKKIQNFDLKGIVQRNGSGRESRLIQVRNEYSPQLSKLLYNWQLKNKEAL